MKKILLTTAILAVFTGYIDNAKAADRLAALRAQLLAKQQQQTTTTVAPSQPVAKLASTLPVPKSIPQIREEDFRNMQTLIKNLELKTKEQEDETQKLKQENTRLLREIEKLKEELNWAVSTIDYVVEYCFGGYSEEKPEETRD